MEPCDAFCGNITTVGEAGHRRIQRGDLAFWEAAVNIFLRYRKVIGLRMGFTLARNWGEGSCHPEEGFFAAPDNFKDRNPIFGVAGCSAFLQEIWNFRDFSYTNL